MDTHTRNLKKSVPEAPMLPAHLYIGPDSTTAAHAKEYIQKTVCAQNGCHTCIACKQIADQQHHKLLWLTTEKSYTREQLQSIFDTLSFARSAADLFFIVIQKADCLTAACANSLLKSIEEPPTGYHFILLTDRVNELLPTIRSRCTITKIVGTDDLTAHTELFQIFTNQTSTNPSVFLKLIEGSKITEYESLQLLDQLLEYWGSAHKIAVTQNEVTAQKYADLMITIIKNALHKPPMPGSSKLLWKNIFLQKESFSAS